MNPCDVCKQDSESLISLHRKMMCIECCSEEAEIWKKRHDDMARTFTKTLEEVKDLRQRKDAAYEERTRVVALLLTFARRLGFRMGVGKHQDVPGEKWDREWRTLVVVDLPTGQASWHVQEKLAYLFNHFPKYEPKWDGHTTEEKYLRIERMMRWKRPAARCDYCGGIDGGYMVHDDLWISLIGPKHCGLVCLDCLQAKLPRPLKLSDFKEVPINHLLRVGYDMAIRKEG